MKLKNPSYLLVILLVFAVLSCKKSGIDLPAVQTLPAHLAFVNVLPKGFPANFYINGTRQNSNRIGFVESSGYLNVITGMQTISFKDTTISRSVYFTSAINLRPDTLYTIFLTGKPGNGGNISTVQTIDTAIVDNVNTKPKVRFVNVAVNAPAFTVYLKDKPYIKFSNQTYKTVSVFDRVDTGRISIKLKNINTNAIILSDSITLQPRGVYTLFSYNSNNNGIDSLKVKSIVNH